VRLDKFLKESRLIKRRALAKMACEAGRVLVNGRAGKPSTEVGPGDSLVLELGSRRLQVEILALQEKVPAREAKNLYRVVGEETDA